MANILSTTLVLTQTGGALFADNLNHYIEIYGVNVSLTDNVFFKITGNFNASHQFYISFKGPITMNGCFILLQNCNFDFAPHITGNEDLFIVLYNKFNNTWIIKKAINSETLAVITTQPKVYRALMTQSSTNPPSVNVLENTLGGYVAWTRQSAGMYFGTLAGAFTGTADPLTSKTFCNISEQGPNSYMKAGCTSTDYIYVATYAMTIEDDSLTFGGSDITFQDSHLEVLVYP